MALRRICISVALPVWAAAISFAEEVPLPTFEAAAGAAQRFSTTPPQAQASGSSAQTGNAGGVPWNATRKPVRDPQYGARQASANASAERYSPTPRQFDPNAKPIKPMVGQADVLKAFELTKTELDEDGYSQVIELCKAGMEKGVDGKMAAYARKLSGWAYNRRGELRADADQVAESLEDFEAAIALDRNSWRAIHNRGVSQVLAGNVDAAIADFTQAIEINPKFANAWFNRGELRYEKRDFAGALKDYNQALKLNANDSVALNSRGHTYYRLRKYAEALADYNKALEIDPDSAAAYVNRGDLHADQGKFAEAASDYRSAINANPQLGRAYQSAAWLMSTCPEEAFRNDELAIEAAQKAIELDGDTDYRYLETLAAAQANAGEFEAAIETQQRAMELAPEAVAQVYQGRIEKFKAGRPHREPAVKYSAESSAGSAASAARRPNTTSRPQNAYRMRPQKASRPR